MKRARFRKQKYIKEPGKIIFDFLTPQKYTLKAIMDRNGNGQMGYRELSEAYTAGKNIFLYIADSIAIQLGPGDNLDNSRFINLNSSGND